MRATRLGIGGLLATGLVALAGAGATVGANVTPLATIVRHGGLCVSGRECRSVFRIGDKTITAPGYLPRPLTGGERRALLRAIAALDLAAIRKHPFRGTCPVAYDGQESVYRFRGFPTPLASCTYDLAKVPAVRLATRLIATMRHR